MGTFWWTGGPSPLELTFSMPSPNTISAIVLRTSGGKGESSTRQIFLHLFALFCIKVAKVLVQGSPTGERFYDIIEQGGFCKISCVIIFCPSSSKL